MKGGRTVEAERAALVAEGFGGALRRWFAPDAAKVAPGTRPAPGQGRFVSRGPGAAAKVQQQHAQPLLGRLVLAQTLRCPSVSRPLPPPGGRNDTSTVQSSSILARSPSCTWIHARKQ